MEMDLTDMELLDVGKELGNEWKLLAGYLGIGQPRISRIESDNPHNTSNAIANMLHAWYTGESKEKCKRTQLIEALKKIDRNDLAETVRQSGITRDHYKQPFQESSKETVCEREEKMEDAPPKGLENGRYKMTSIPRGLCLIINNMQFSGAFKELKGYEVDARKLESLFKEFGFVVDVVHRNKSAVEMKDLIKGASEKNHEKYDCFVCCILSHGNEGVVFGSDAQSCKIRFFTDAVLKCDTLAGKPKLFFVQACQGSRVSKPVEVTSAAIGSISDCSDVLVAYSTPPGFVSYVYTEIGSLYITTLVDALRKYCNTKDILEILTDVNNEMSKHEIRDEHGTLCMQVAAPQYTLRKKLFFTKIR